MKGAIANVVDGDGGDEHFMDEVKVAVASNDAPMHIGNGETSSGNEHEQRSLSNVQHPNMNQKKNEEMVVLLKEDVAGSKRKLELQAVNIGRGFKSVLQMKNEELDKLKNKNMELQKKVTVLEDQLAERDVHDVTQAFQVVEVGRNSEGVSEEGFGRGSVVICDVSPLRVVGQRGDKVIDAYTEVLKTEQLRMYGNDELANKSYFFNSMCLDMVKNNDVRVMEKYVRRNVLAGSEFRYIHFPMCHLAHWTLVVYILKTVVGRTSIR
ncbi:hypothetical protein LOK49_Contig528G00001 [Camellia lanceoleosa]|nr:hypothetical protein LOK49_Contig528G00001 [Camellia lanceoleosa]